MVFSGARRAAPVALLSLALAGAGAERALLRRPAYVPLHSEAVAVDATGERHLVPPGADPGWVGGTRAVDTPGSPARTATEAAGQSAWLAAGTVPGAGGPFEDMARTALLDLRALTPDGAPVAGWTGHWRYVWPRDASFVAVAYARTGHLPDALAALAFLQRVQAPDGSFHARYLPDGSGPPDARGIQEDGPGWVLWALSSVSSDPEVLARYRPLLDRSAARLLARVAGGLPAPSSDYWEVRETRLTLGIAAPTLAGLDAAAHLYDLLGEPGRAAAARAAADRTAAAVERAFGPRYPRHLGGREVDAAVTFLLPPFQRRAVAGAREAASRAVPRMLRQAGGVAPGEGWKADGISWTPETALFALTAAATGDAASAERWLRWLDEHRTAAGAIPEKVLYDGSPAAVAPLAWSAALVLLALAG